MTQIKRDLYLNQLVAKMHNGKVKIITGIRRCGKSYLLSHIFRDYLSQQQHVDDAHIIEIALDRMEHERLRNPNELYSYVMSRLVDSKDYYLFIDEIQLSYRVKREGVDISIIPEEDRHLAYMTFYDVLNDLMAKPNLDIYVTGSNSRMLSNRYRDKFQGPWQRNPYVPLKFQRISLDRDDGKSGCMGRICCLWWDASDSIGAG